MLDPFHKKGASLTMTGMGFESCADEEDPSSVSSSLVNYGGKMIDVFRSWYVDQYVHDHISTTK